jgi:hypothetical protein
MTTIPIVMLAAPAIRLLATNYLAFIKLATRIRLAGPDANLT